MLSYCQKYGIVPFIGSPQEAIMIFDWLENCESIERTGSYSFEDNWDQKALPRQEQRYVEYLRYNLRLNKEAAKERWLKVRGGYADVFSYDKDLVDVQFDKLWAATESRKYRRPITKTYDVCIRKGELDALNALEAPLWIKQYWFGLLVWLKHQYANCRPMRNNQDVQRWIIKQIDTPFSMQEALRRQINVWNKKCGNVTSKFAWHQRKNGKQQERFFTMLTMKFAEILPPDVKTEVVIDGLNPENFSAYLGYVEPTMTTCPNCGKKFIKNFRAKTALCDDCEKNKRRQAAAAAMRKRRAAIAATKNNR